MTGCRQERPASKAPVLKTYRLKGTVRRLDGQTQVAVIEHETIADAQGEVWMDAMTMEFPVKHAAEFERLQRGMRIEARVIRDVDTYEYWIEGIETRSGK